MAPDKKRGNQNNDRPSRSRDEAQESDNDENAAGAMQYLEIDQNPRQRLRIRREYRDLMTILQRDKHDYIAPESSRLNDALTEANSLNKQVRLPREGALDSQTVLMITNLGRQKAEALHTDFVKFDPVEFAQKLITFIGGAANRDSDARVTPQGWIMLGSAVQKFYNRSPAFHYMSGSFERGERIIPQKQKPKAVKEKENLSETATVPKQMQTFEDGKKEGTTQEVERIFDLLKKYYRDTNENPICYFEFVLNPDSFGQTVENMFYVSFLVKDGHAKITLDDDRLPLIEPLETDEGATQSKENSRNRQAIVTITPAEWKELIEVYKIEVPLIPTRVAHSTRPAMNESTSRAAVSNQSTKSSQDKRRK